MLTALALSVCASAYAQFAHTQGEDVVDGSGKVIHLKGTSLGNWMVPEGYMWRLGDGTQSPKEIENLVVELIGPSRAAQFWHDYRARYITQDDIRFLRAQGFNVIRVPLHWKLFQTPDDEGFQLLDNVVRWSHEAGLYVVLDLHAAPGGQTGANIDDGHGYPWLFVDAGAQQQTIDLWKRLAEHYRDEPAVLGYDLLNEPIPNFPGLESLNPRLEPLYKRIAAAIRSVDQHHILILGGAQWDTNLSVFGPPFDSNTIYTVHKYWVPPVQAQIEPWLEFRERYHVPIWLGESGENTDEWIATFRALLEKNNIGWAFWPYKKMQATSAVVTIAPPQGWDQIVAFSKLPRGDGPVKERQAQRPPQPVIDAAFAGLLENIQLTHCSINAGYIHAMLPDAPAIPSQ
jgi:endoglucanase